MIKRLIAVLIIGGACSAYPHEDESSIGFASPIEGPADPVRGPTNPEGAPFTAQNGNIVAVAAEVPEEVPNRQEGLKPEGSDLKTDATFWWPSYRAYWGYPSYARSSYWTYPSYRYYRPRTYYRYYYW